MVQKEEETGMEEGWDGNIRQVPGSRKDLEACAGSMYSQGSDAQGGA